MIGKRNGRETKEDTSRHLGEFGLSYLTKTLTSAQMSGVRGC